MSAPSAVARAEREGCAGDAADEKSVGHRMQGAAGEHSACERKRKALDDAAAARFRDRFREQR
jgi:hypothetical protein